MPGPNVDVGTALAVFIDGQAANALDTPATDYPVAADAVRALPGVTTSGPAAFSFYEDKRDTSTKQGVISEKREASLALECYAYMTTVGTAPDWWDLLLYGGWQQQTGPAATTVTGVTSTTTVIALTTAAGITVKGCAEISGELRRITAVDAAGAPNTITVTPALSSAPVATTIVSFGITAYPKDARADDQDALTGWAGNNRSMERFVGWVIDTLNLSMGGTGAAKITASGPARERNLLYSTALSAGINDAVTTIPVDDGTACPADASATNPFYFEVGTEVLKIIAVSGNNWTSDTRGVYAHGGAAAAHLEDAEVFPAVPTGTYAGTPAPATSGQIILNGDDMQLGEVSLACEMGVVPREGQHGDKWAFSGYVLGMRSIKPSGNGSSFYDEAGVRMQEATNRTAIQFFAQQGGSSGAIIAFECPTVRLDFADYARGEDEVQIAMGGEAEGTSAGEDEIYIMVA
jgi:hypothetical protein